MHQYENDASVGVAAGDNNQQLPKNASSLTLAKSLYLGPQKAWVLGLGLEVWHSSANAMRSKNGCFTLDQWHPKEGVICVAHCRYIFRSTGMIGHI